MKLGYEGEVYKGIDLERIFMNVVKTNTVGGYK